MWITIPDASARLASTFDPSFAAPIPRSFGSASTARSPPARARP
jgi:hypothetical protein